MRYVMRLSDKRLIASRSRYAYGSVLGPHPPLGVGQHTYLSPPVGGPVCICKRPAAITSSLCLYGDKNAG